MLKRTRTTTRRTMVIMWMETMPKSLMLSEGEKRMMTRKWWWGRELRDLDAPTRSPASHSYHAGPGG
jgi:hypothetical protein